MAQKKESSSGSVGGIQRDEYDFELVNTDMMSKHMGVGSQSSIYPVRGGVASYRQVQEEASKTIKLHNHNNVLLPITSSFTRYFYY